MPVKGSNTYFKATAQYVLFCCWFGVQTETFGEAIQLANVEKSEFRIFEFSRLTLCIVCFCKYRLYISSSLEMVLNKIDGS